MANFIGRILLLVACAFMGYSAVMTGIECFEIFQAHDWADFSQFGEIFPTLGLFLMQVVVMIFVLAGIVAALKGKATLKLTLLSFILLINVVLTFITAFKGDPTFDFMKVLNITISCIYPILYILGSFFIRF